MVWSSINTLRGTNSFLMITDGENLPGALKTKIRRELSSAVPPEF